MLERMKIGVRLGIGLSVILLFMIIVAAFGIYSLHDVNKKIGSSPDRVGKIISF